MEIEKLLPCPFCGGEAKGAGACSAGLGIPGDIEIYSIDCQSDDCTATLMLDTKAQTIAAWNTRAPADLRSALEAETIEKLRRIRTSMVLLQQNSEACAVTHYGDDRQLHGMPGWLTDTAADIARLTDIIAALAPTKGDVS